MAVPTTQAPPAPAKTVPLRDKNQGKNPVPMQEFEQTICFQNVIDESNQSIHKIHAHTIGKHHLVTFA